MGGMHVRRVLARVLGRIIGCHSPSSTRGSRQARTWHGLELFPTAGPAISGRPLSDAPRILTLLRETRPEAEVGHGCAIDLLGPPRHPAARRIIS
jgi:hypothetical protein